MDDPGLTDDASLAERSAIGRLLSLADRTGTEVRSGEGWVAVRTGLGSDDLNGAVSLGAGAELDDALVADLSAWWGNAPARWLVPDPDPGLMTLLSDAGWLPERGGRWAGRALDEPLPPGTGAIPMGDPADHLGVAQACGRSDAAEHEARRLLLTPHPLWHHVVVRRDGRAVGAASAFLGASLELVDVTVLPELRRAGVGSALVGALTAWGAERGARRVVAAPGPDGADFLGALGFVEVPATPDVRARWPGTSSTT